MLKLDVKEGESWEYDMPGPGGAVAGKMKYWMGKREEVPAGKFQAVRVDGESTWNGEVWKRSAWFSPGVELVKSESGAGKQKIVQELKEFTLGK